MALAHVSCNDCDSVAQNLYWSRKSMWDLGLMYTSQHFSGGVSMNKGARSDSAGDQIGGKFSASNFAVAASWTHTAHAAMVADPL